MFIEAAEDTFKTMCHVGIVRDGSLFTRTWGTNPVYDMTGCLRISGRFTGSILINMNKDIAQKAVENFLGEAIKDDATTADGFGELLNMIVGGASARLGNGIRIALPTVSMGQDQQIHSLKQYAWLVIPMEIPEWGKFNIEVAIREMDI